jgi:pilus assembly protein CpaF
MLQSMNTGHDGSMTTLHANSPRDALSRLETMVAMAELSLPDKAVRAQIASAVDIIVQVSRLSDGSRRVKQISRDRRHGRGRHHHAGHLHVRADGGR